MRISSTIILAVIALALSALVVLFSGEEYRNLIFGKPLARTGENLFPAAALDKVRKITLSNSDGDTAHFVLNENYWQATKPWKDRADPLHMRALMQFTALLKVEDIIPVDDLSLEECGLLDEHIRVTMRDNGGNTICDYQIGRQTAWHVNNEELKTRIPSIFIRPTQQDLKHHVYVCTETSADAIHKLFNNQFERFRDHHPFYFSPRYLEKIRIQGTQGDVVISRQDVNSPWALTKPLELRIDPDSLQNLFKDLAQLTAISVEDRANVTLPSGEGATAQARELSIQFANAEEETILRIYPAAEESDTTVLATVSDRPDAVFQLPLTAAVALPNTTSLSKLELGVNDLRSKTMTHLNGPQLKTVILKPEGLMPVMLQRTPKTSWRVLRKSGWEEANQDALINLMTAVTRDHVQKFVTDAATDLTPYGLHQPFLQIAFISFNNESMRVAFGRDAENQEIYACIVGKPNIWQISPETLGKIAQHSWQWRTSHVWHIPRIDIQKITIHKRDQPAVELHYDHFTGNWTAKRNGQNASASLNPNRADKLLSSMDSLKTSRWLGPLHPQAMIALQEPDMAISVTLRKYDEQGNDLPPVEKTLRISQTPGGYITFAKVDTLPINPEDDVISYFLLPPESVKKLNVDLFE